MRIINKHEGPSSTYTTTIESLWKMMVQKLDSMELLDMVLEKEKERKKKDK